MVRTHQLGQAVFRSVLPEDIDWKPFPAFPPSARLAILVGEPSQPGPYVIRVKMPADGLTTTRSIAPRNSPCRSMERTIALAPVGRVSPL